MLSLRAFLPGAVVSIVNSMSRNYKKTCPQPNSNAARPDIGTLVEINDIRMK